jgi:hypothetical protein
MGFLRDLFFPEASSGKERTEAKQNDSDDLNQVGLLRNLIVDLRKELVEAQKIRAQIIQIKITSVGAGIGLIAANIGGIAIQLFVIPAFAAIFFDFLITSYGSSIKRIGYYCRTYVEPHIEKPLDVLDTPNEFLWWEEFLAQFDRQTKHALLGNLGLTALAVIVGGFALFLDSEGQRFGPD